MNYTDKTLTFDSNKIYFYNSDLEIEQQVMMDWEDSLMSASAAENSGIAFGTTITLSFNETYPVIIH